MPIEVTLNIFSGRQNPNWALSAAQEKDLLDLLETIKTPTLSKPSGVTGRLGYRGFILRRSREFPQGGLRLFVHEGIVDLGQDEENRRADNRDLERWLLGTAPGQLGENIRKVVAAELIQPPLNAVDIFNARAVAAACPACQSQDAPVYNPSLWNAPNVQPYNNCYNYANDQITNTFAQTGLAYGIQMQTIACPDVDLAARADGLVGVLSFSNPLGPGQGWYVALVVWPGLDYHWYRQDQNGCWSHKPGPAAARNTDNSGNAITDPKFCDRGPYVDFCTYMITNRGVAIR